MVSAGFGTVRSISQFFAKDSSCCYLTALTAVRP